MIATAVTASKFSNFPLIVLSKPFAAKLACQRRRRREYHHNKIRSDPLYADTVSRSRKKWRDAHPGYQKQYWQTHPKAAERNRQQQRQRDRRRRLRHACKEQLSFGPKGFSRRGLAAGPHRR